MTRLILAAAIALAVLAVLRRRPEPVEDEHEAGVPGGAWCDPRRFVGYQSGRVYDLTDRDAAAAALLNGDATANDVRAAGLSVSGTRYDSIRIRLPEQATVTWRH